MFETGDWKVNIEEKIKAQMQVDSSLYSFPAGLVKAETPLRDAGMLYDDIDKLKRDVQTLAKAVERIQSFLKEAFT